MSKDLKADIMKAARANNTQTKDTDKMVGTKE